MADGNRNLALKGRLCLAKYFALFVTKYRPKLRAPGVHLRQQSRLSLHLDLNLDLNPDLYPSLHRAFLTKFCQ
ncbi:hypothetical protein FJY68_10370 [candidate division WOR-3 bacterium]|uniref:Uncharacterized protein n=1 Tax=candidate division WOR-3 bacterium TaxID=2052148 RepID=A0A938BU19_UNCW3|nr:hypothetical protein [candidate division WOR-3 bacterium]